jgi:peptidoglycan-associated lipoprotein
LKNDVLSLARAQSCVDYLIQKGVSSQRLTAVGMGEKEPFTISQGYTGLGADKFKGNDVMTERYIKSLSAENQEVANQINRRTDFKVLSDDYVPTEASFEEDDGDFVSNKKSETQIGQTITLSAKDRSLGKIAMNNGMNVVELKKLNAGLRGARPLPGMVIKVTKNGDYKSFDESHYQVQRGDILRTIAKKTGSGLKDIRELNDFKNDKDLIVGSWIQIK